MSAAFSPDGERVVTASEDRDGADLGRRERRASSRFSAGTRSWVQSAAFSPDGERVVTASDDRRRGSGTPRAARQLVTLRGHEDCVKSAAFSPDGERVVTASDDGTARIWDAESGAQLDDPARAQRLGLQRRLQPRRRAGGDRERRSDGADLGRRERRASSRSCAGTEGLVMSAAFSPDGERVVTASDDDGADLGRRARRASS